MADVLLVDALVMERLALVLVLVTSRLALVLVMTGLLKSRRGPTGPLAAELMVLSGRPKPIRWFCRYHGSSILIIPNTNGLSPLVAEYYIIISLQSNAMLLDIT